MSLHFFLSPATSFIFSHFTNFFLELCWSSSLSFSCFSGFKLLFYQFFNPNPNYITQLEQSLNFSLIFYFEFYPFFPFTFSKTPHFNSFAFYFFYLLLMFRFRKLLLVSRFFLLFLFLSWWRFILTHEINTIE